MSLNIFIPFFNSNSLNEDSFYYLIQTIVHLNEVLSSSSIPHSFTLLICSNVSKDSNSKEIKKFFEKKFEQKFEILEIDLKEFSTPTHLIKKLLASNHNSSYCTFYPYIGTHHATTLVEIYNTIKSQAENTSAIFCSRFEKKSQNINFSKTHEILLLLTKFNFFCIKLITLILKLKIIKLRDLENDLAIYNVADLLSLTKQKKIQSKNLDDFISFEMPLIFSNFYNQKVLNYPDKNINSWIKQKINGKRNRTCYQNFLCAFLV